MFDVFSDEIELQIKIGLSNLYWFHNDLKKAWLRSGVSEKMCASLFGSVHAHGTRLTKRELMDELYLQLRTAPYNRRLEISRNFARILIEQRDFNRQNDKHRIEIAEMAALKLRELYRQQVDARDSQPKGVVQQKERVNAVKPSLDSAYKRFIDSLNLEPHKRGYELECVFTDLMRANGMEVFAPFKIVGEQIDGGIKHDGHFYLIEIKWTSNKTQQPDIASLYMKVEGKLDSTRGIFISMNGFSEEMKYSMIVGKTLRVLLLDGMHITNALAGVYSFKQLLDYAIEQASLKGIVYCNPSKVLD